MGFITAIKTCMGKYATFRGRASRSEYWYFTLFMAILNLIAVIITVAMLGMVSGLLYLIVFLTVSLILNTPLFLPSLAVSIRRLHDLDKSGWWVLVILIPVLGFLILAWWGCRRGTEGQNMYGSDPLWTALLPAP